MVDEMKGLMKWFSTCSHRRLVQYRTAYYSFYLPVACALLMVGENLENHIDVKNVLVDMGIYFQVQENYGKPDPSNVAKVKDLYKELDREGVFMEYESKSYEKLTEEIEGHKSKAIQAVLKSFLAKIYKRQN